MFKAKVDIYDHQEKISLQRMIMADFVFQFNKKNELKIIKNRYIFEKELQNEKKKIK